MTQNKYGIDTGPQTDANGFHDWMSMAKAGERFCYFIGEFAFELYQHATPDLIELGRVTRSAQETRKVCLTQTRLGEHCFAYFATRRPSEDFNRVADKRLLAPAGA